MFAEPELLRDDNFLSDYFVSLGSVAFSFDRLGQWLCTAPPQRSNLSIVHENDGKIGTCLGLRAGERHCILQCVRLVGTSVLM